MDSNTVEVLKTIGDKVGQTVEHMWPAAVQYTFAQGVSGVVGGLVIAAITGFASWACYKKIDHEDTYESAGWVVGLIFGVFICLGGVIEAISEIPDVIAPEGALIHEIVSSVRK